MPMHAHTLKRAQPACCQPGSCNLSPSNATLNTSSGMLCEMQVDQKRQRPDLTAQRGGRMDTLNKSSLSLSSFECTSLSGEDALASCCSSDDSFSEPDSRASSFSSMCSDVSCTSSSSARSQCSLPDCEQWRARETVYTPRGIFKLQNTITPGMREMLVEWMCEVVIQYRMHLETFLLAVNYVDRYMSKVAVPRTRFQLLGLTCLWIAAKYEEVHPPSARQLLDMADNAYHKHEMIALEGEIMRVLEWQLSPATTLKFMHLYLVHCQATSYTVQAVAECMLQLAALDWALCAEQPPAHVAAAATCVALTTCQLTHLVPQVVVASGWTDAQALAQMSHDLYARFGRLSAPGMPFHPIIAHYAQRQRAINRRMQLENSVAQCMVPPAVTTMTGYRPVAAGLPPAAPVHSKAAVAMDLPHSVAAKLSCMAVNSGPTAMDCAPSMDQTHKLTKGYAAAPAAFSFDTTGFGRASAAPAPASKVPSALPTWPFSGFKARAH